MKSEVEVWLEDSSGPKIGPVELFSHVGKREAVVGITRFIVESTERAFDKTYHSRVSFINYFAWSVYLPERAPSEVFKHFMVWRSDTQKCLLKVLYALDPEAVLKILSDYPELGFKSGYKEEELWV